MKTLALISLVVSVASFSCSGANFDMPLPDDSKLSASNDTASPPDDARTEDVAESDAATGSATDAASDSGAFDSGAADASDTAADVAPDTAIADATPDTVIVDSAPVDSGSDSGVSDSGVVDSGSIDTGSVDTGSDAGTDTSDSGRTEAVFPTGETYLGCCALKNGVYMNGAAYMIGVFPERTKDVRKLTIEIVVDDKVTGCTNREWSVSYNRAGLGKIGFTSSGSVAGKKTLTGTFTSPTPISYIDGYDTTGKAPAPLIIDGGGICSGGSGLWIFVPGGRVVLE